MHVNTQCVFLRLEMECAQFKLTTCNVTIINQYEHDLHEP